ncbi:NAD(P)H-binding protein [Pedobacter sp. UYP1]|uniref:SDR family oxidoreductase n=1 Tax=Pedobacter sp. UYP1 TaxID=1756396 RepID=UPI00339245B1
MNIILTGSIGNIGKPLTQTLVQNGHTITVISSQADRQPAIEALGAQAAIGSMQDASFLARTFQGADIVYLMETLDTAGGDESDEEVDFISIISQIGLNYKQAIEQSGVKKVIHLSSIGAHMDKGNGFLVFHHNVEHILKQLPAEVSIKTLRPVGFYTNMFSFISTIKHRGAIISNYGGDQKEPWVSPLDIASVIAEEIGQSFEGRTMRYIASDEVSPNEIARALGDAIGKPDLQWKVISDEQLLNSWLSAGFNPQIAQGFIEMQANQGTGKLYEDYYRNQPVLGKVKLAGFARNFAAVYQQEE